VKSQHAARSYAKALFELARERQQTDVVGRELAGVIEVVASDSALPQFLARPGISSAAKRAVADEIAQRLGVSKLVRDFVGLVADQGRGEQLPDIADAYRDLVDADAGRVRARVRSAVALTEQERSTLASRLGAALGKTVVVEDRVDRELLGGLVAEVGSLVADGSLDGQLARIKDRLERG
jgi:F-type H+-transporting ATPase subunit delta